MMKKSLLLTTLLSAGLMLADKASAQLSTNPDKFLGNITTRYNVDTDGYTYWKFWNQITPENESKWGSVEGNRGSFNWGGADNCYNYAKNHNFPFKFHAIIWGAQHPNWFNSNLSVAERKKAIINWMDAMKKHYPKLDIIDVANECVSGHQADTYLFQEPLGGAGLTGWDWLITAFKEAHKRWPEAILIYNDFNTFQWNTDQFIELCTALRDGGAPIDAYGCQSHDLTDCNVTNFKNSCTKIQNALKMPMYISEYDIGTDDDNLQLQRYKEQIPYMWEADYCAGVTLWGWIYGATWTDNGNSGIIKNKKDRPAMTWLKEYMATDVAKNAKSPFPGMKKPISLYIQPSIYKPSLNEETTIHIEATMHNGNTVEKVEFYVGNTLTETLTEAPYDVKYTPTAKGKKNLKAIVYDSAGNKYERLGAISVVGPRTPFYGTPAELPGTIEVEDFDKGDDGIAYHDSDTQNDGKSTYRKDAPGVDVYDKNNGHVIGMTRSGEWLEYTVNVTKAGYYEYAVVAATGASNAAFSLAMNQDGKLTDLTSSIKVPMIKQDSWDDFSTITGRTTVEMPEGEYALRLRIDGDYCDLDKMTFRHVEMNNNIKVSISASPAPITVSETTTIKVNASCTTAKIAYVNLYINDALKKKMTDEPYEYDYKATTAGKYNVTAIAFDENGAESKVASYTLTVNPKRTPYKGVIAIPGTIEAENFDKQGEGLSFHDSDDKNEGDVTNYRTDAGGVDFVKGNNGTCIGYTKAGEWLEYTVNVKEGGKYAYEAIVSSGVQNSGFTLGLVKDGKVTNITSKITVPMITSNDWNTYSTVKGNLTKALEAGEQVIRITINGDNCNIDKIKLICTEPNAINDISAEAGQYQIYTPSGVYVGKVEADSDTQLYSRIHDLAGKGIYIVRNVKTGASKKLMAY